MINVVGFHHGGQKEMIQKIVNGDHGKKLKVLATEI